MFDLPFSIPSKTQKTGLPPSFPIAVADHGLPFALTMAVQVPAAMMSGKAAHIVLERFATLAEAMLGAINYADDLKSDKAPQLLAILDRDERLVLAGAASDGAVAWCHPVRTLLRPGRWCVRRARSGHNPFAPPIGTSLILRSGGGTAPISWTHALSTRCGAPSLPALCRLPRDAREAEEGS